MLCTELVVPPTIKKACAAPKASAASSSASLDHRYRVAEVVQGLHAVYVHTHALLTQKSGQLRVAPAALVARHIKRHHPHLTEAFQRFVDGGPAADPAGDVLRSRSLRPPKILFRRGLFRQKKNARPHQGAWCRACVQKILTGQRSESPARGCWAGKTGALNGSLVRVYIAITFTTLSY